jgi:hypothetical protein
MSDTYINSLDGYFSLRLQTVVIALKKMLNGWSYIEKGQTMQWPKEIERKDKQWPTKHYTGN